MSFIPSRNYTAVLEPDCVPIGIDEKTGLVIMRCDWCAENLMEVPEGEFCEETGETFVGGFANQYPHLMFCFKELSKAVDEYWTYYNYYIGIQDGADESGRGRYFDTTEENFDFNKTCDQKPKK
jgi:hypothetical protein